ncbi:MAG: DUF2339 domain-containing protein, partial [Pseudomonadota bacterium]
MLDLLTDQVVLLFAGLFALYSLYRRQAKLAARVEQLEKALETASWPAAPPNTDSPSAQPETPRVDDAETPRAATAAAEHSPHATWAGPEESLAEPEQRFARMEQFFAWLQANWVLTAGTLSLALAGVFLVQYGAERGYLTPLARVLCALALGLVLIAAGEFLRRRFGDTTETATRLLPSALSGVGFMTLFVAVLAARGLYQLIDPGTAFLSLALISALSVLCGWFYGPFLSAVGIVGALAAPYLVGGKTDTPWLLSYYFLFIALVALAIDTIKRLAWLSVLGVAGAAASIWLIYLTSGFAGHFLIASSLVWIAALVLPERALQPALDGPPVTGFLLRKGSPSFPVWLAGAALVNAVLAAVIVGVEADIADNLAAVGTLALILVLAVFWLAKAPALIDFPAVPLLGFLAVVLLLPALHGGLYADFTRPLEEREQVPATVWLLSGLALAFGVLGYRRLGSLQDVVLHRVYALVSAAIAPAAVFALEWAWTPAVQYGANTWAFGITLVAIASAAMAIHSTRRSALPEPQLVAALFTVTALVLVGLALFVALTKTALSLGIALMVVCVVQLDRRYNLPLIQYVVKLGILIIGYRAVVDPGVLWAIKSGTGASEATLAYAGPLAALGAARLLAPSDRKTL